MSKRIIVIILFVILLAGASYIIYNGRPVMKLKNQPATQTTNTTGTQTPANNLTNTNGQAPAIPTGYTLADVAKHNTQNDCWSAINGGVYALTEYVARHPGGPGRIVDICGIDSSASFNNQHKNSRTAQAALGLLKVGDLR